MSSEFRAPVDRSRAESVHDRPPADDVTDLLDPAQDLLGRKWLPVVVYHLAVDGSMGFSELKRTIGGISSKMLSTSLDRLEQADVVERTVRKAKPVRVTYALTPRGEALEPIIVAMVRWSRDGTRPA